MPVCSRCPYHTPFLADLAAHQAQTHQPAPQMVCLWVPEVDVLPLEPQTYCLLYHRPQGSYVVWLGGGWQAVEV